MIVTSPDRLAYDSYNHIRMSMNLFVTYFLTATQPVNIPLVFT